MATPEQTNLLQTLLNELIEPEIESLIRNSDWGSINFEAAQFDLERLYKLCNHLSLLPLENIPNNPAQRIQSTGEALKPILSKIRNFSIEVQNPASVRDQIVKEIATHVDAFYTEAHLYVPYLAYLRGEVQSNIDELNASIKQAAEILSKTEKNAEVKKKEIDGIVSAAREATAKVGVAHFTSDFETKAGELATSAKNWLYVTAAFALATIAALAYFLYTTPTIDGMTLTVNYVSTKVLVLLFLVTATIWCGNIYKATLHQSSANRFKADALKTFQAFVKAADNDAIRDAVLLETTKAIFTESATGLISENGNSDSHSQIIELVRNTSSSKG